MDERVALITGAGSGIGRAAALALQCAGFTVVVTGRRSTELNGTAEMSSKNGSPMAPLPSDISDPESVRSLFSSIGKRFGRLDLLFNNAGIGGPTVPLDEIPMTIGLRS